MTSYPYISKQCLSLMMTLDTERSEFTMMLWIPAKHAFTASAPCFVVMKRFSSPMDHFKSVVSASYASSFFWIAWFVRCTYGLSMSALLIE